MNFIGELVVRLRRARVGTDRAGGPLYEWAGVELPIRCALDPGGSKEPVEVGRAQVVTTPKAYFPEPVDVIAGDRLRIRNLDFDVQGDPALWVSPFRENVSGIVVELQATSEEG